MRKYVAAPIRGIMAQYQFEEVLDSTDLRKQLQHDKRKYGAAPMRGRILRHRQQEHNGTGMRKDARAP